MRQGPAAGQAVMDTGAMCLPGLSDKVAALVQDARAKGAQVLPTPASLTVWHLRTLLQVPMMSGAGHEQVSHQGWRPVRRVPAHSAQVPRQPLSCMAGIAC